MSIHLYCCSFCRSRISEFQDYYKNQERKSRKKLVLPPILPWEYGSNKFASQKGTGGFGSMRNATTSVQSSKELSESSDGVVPRLSCPPLWDKELGSQSGLIPFGGIREHALKVQDKEGEQKKDIHKLANKESESILKIWAQPNPDAKLNKPFGHKRNEVTEMTGGRRFSAEELRASRAAIPRFQDPRHTIAAKAEKEQKQKESAGSLIIPPPFAHLAVQQSRIYSKLGLEACSPNRACSSSSNNENELTAEQYMAWLGGQLTLQSRTVDYQQQKNRSYASYYDRLMSERTATKHEIREKLKQLEFERNNATAHQAVFDSDRPTGSSSSGEKEIGKKKDTSDENQNVHRTSYRDLQIIEEEERSSLEDEKNEARRNSPVERHEVVTAME